MRSLTISKTGIWYFRFQLPNEHRHFFDGRSEIKRSLQTSCKNVAKIQALSLELTIRSQIQEECAQKINNSLLNLSSSVSTPKRSLLGACPYQCLAQYYSYKTDFVTNKSTMMQKNAKLF
jgi:hypothetical protein